MDEVHAIAGTKRGAHLALSLERLERLRPARHGSGTSSASACRATQRPLETIARFLGGTGEGREVAIVDAGTRKPLELQVVVPVEDMARLGEVLPQDEQPGGPVLGGEMRTSIWPAIHPRILELIRAHRSTIVFTNSRRLAERLAQRLNELAGEELVRAHHGSIAREQRLEIEEELKAGRLPALVATSSLELGIDMGAVDLVIQVESPTSVARGLQRIGRAGHQVGRAVARASSSPSTAATSSRRPSSSRACTTAPIESDDAAAQPARRPRPAARRDDHRRSASRWTSCWRSSAAPRRSRRSPGRSSRASWACSPAPTRRTSSRSSSRGSPGTA